MRITLLAGACVLALTTTVQAQGVTDLLDLTKVKVRPEKMTDYETAVKKLVELNRKYKGDHWLVFTTEYGQALTYYFSSPRENMAAVETGLTAFRKTLNEGLGPAGSAKLFQDLVGASSSAESEIRRRRPDLSVNPPADQAALSKIVARTRWIRTVKLDLKPGKILAFAAAWKPFQAELAALGPDVMVLASQSVTGSSAMYFASYFKSMADIDSADAVMRKAVASEAYRDLLQNMSDTVSASTWEIHRVRPDLSYVPDELAAIDPGFWKPKAAAIPQPKPKAPATTKGL